MKNIFVLLFSCILASCSTGKKEQSHFEEPVLKAGELPLEFFFRNPVARSVEISPDGKWLASLQPYKGRMNVFVKGVNEKEWQNITKVEDRDISRVFWKNNNTLLFLKDFGGDENFHLFRVARDGKNFRDLTDYPNTRVQIIDELNDISESDILVGLNKRDAKVFDVYRVNTESGATEMVLQNPGNYTSYLTDNKGVLRVAIATDGVNKNIYYRKDKNSEFKVILSLNFKDKMDLISFDKQNKNIYALTNKEGNTISAVLWNPVSGKILKNLYTNKNYDVVDISYSLKRQEPIAAIYQDWKTEYHFLSKYYKNAYQDIQKKIKDYELSISSTNKNEDLFVVSALSDRTGTKYYLYDVKNKKLDFILDSTPWLKTDELVEMKPIEYTTRDGLKILGYLFLPKNKESKELPTIINPHGGPWYRDIWGFSPDSQFFANRGYAVLKMNFRGSTGFGKKFWMSSFKQWGKTMQDDITDGVNWLVQKGIADKDRIAIYGGSYGGYATLAGLAFTPDLYRCGVDYVGVSNIFTLLETIPPYWLPMREMYYEMIGHPEKDKELLTQASPLFSADKIKAPLFVAQGAKDPRVKKSESDQIVEALKRRGIDVPYLVKDNEGHGFRNEENRMEFYKKTEAFLNKHMKVRE